MTWRAESGRFVQTRRRDFPRNATDCLHRHITITESMQISPSNLMNEQASHSTNPTYPISRNELDHPPGLLDLPLRLLAEEPRPHHQRHLRDPSLAQHLRVPERQQVEHGRRVGLLRVRQQVLVALLRGDERPQLGRSTAVSLYHSLTSLRMSIPPCRDSRPASRSGCSACGNTACRLCQSIPDGTCRRSCGGGAGLRPYRDLRDAFGACRLVRGRLRHGHDCEREKERSAMASLRGRCQSSDRWPPQLLPAWRASLRGYYARKATHCFLVLVNRVGIVAR